MFSHVNPRTSPCLRPVNKVIRHKAFHSIGPFLMLEISLSKSLSSRTLTFPFLILGASTPSIGFTKIFLIFTADFREVLSVRWTWFSDASLRSWSSLILEYALVISSGFSASSLKWPKTGLMYRLISNAIFSEVLNSQTAFDWIMCQESR